MFFLLTDFATLVDLLNKGNLSIFILGLLSTLSVYHFLLYFQYRDKSYLYYSLYTLLISIFIINKIGDSFLSEFAASLEGFLIFVNIPLQWLTYSVYVFFLMEFIDLKQENLRWYIIFKNIIIVNLVVLSLVVIYSYLNTDRSFMITFFYSFVAPIFLILGVVALFVVAKIKSFIKYYVIVGSVFYLLLTMIALYFVLAKITGSLYVFYFAAVIENIFFALGLGSKQKKLLTDKNTAQRAVIKEHKLNLILQEKIKRRLDGEVALQTEKILTLIEKNKKEEQHKLAIEYSKNTLDLRMRALQTQMNPHFLFNALNSIKYFIINNKKEDATYFLSKLSRLIRKILDNSQQKEITLKEELEIMQLYLEVENIRLRKQIDFEIVIAPNINTTQIKIPPIVLQPFIENAIWHGLALKKGERKIKITITKSVEILVIHISDNGIGRERAAINKAARLIEKESLGIDLTKERLEAFVYHLKKSSVIRFEDLYEDNKPTGTKVIIEIPLK